MGEGLKKSVFPCLEYPAKSGKTTVISGEPSYGEDSFPYHGMRTGLTHELDPGFRRDDAVLAMTGK
jgi:hypothetical protein